MFFSKKALIAAGVVRVPRLATHSVAEPERVIFITMRPAVKVRGESSAILSSPRIRRSP